MAAWIIANVMRLLAWTLRYRVDGGCGTSDFPDEPVIFALWHNRLFLCMKVYEHMVRGNHQHEELAALISASRDGALLSSVLQNFGVQAVRGSSSRRGAQAMRELISWARKVITLRSRRTGRAAPVMRCTTESSRWRRRLECRSFPIPANSGGRCS